MGLEIIFSRLEVLRRERGRGGGIQMMRRKLNWISLPSFSLSSFEEISEMN
jgi:hypothetical protein